MSPSKCYNKNVEKQKEIIDLDKKFQALSKALTISVAYAANAGGTGTIIGNPVNMVLKGQADK